MAYTYTFSYFHTDDIALCIFIKYLVFDTLDVEDFQKNTKS